MMENPSKFGSASVVPQPALPLYGTTGQQSAQYGQQQPIQQQPSLYVPFPAQVTIQTIAVPANVETRMAQFMFPCHPSANINPVRMTCPSYFTEANKRFNHKVTLIEHFAKRWRMEYLTGLREFHRVAGDQSAHVKIGSVVQIMDNSPRMMWKLAVIEDLITGKDGVVRAVKLRTSNGLITTRPIVKLVPLEI
ncbi:unnamed protein product [Mytilus edulis]|uniref:DUF5641 domain-containing protein n=1 Tax=Mytilus edulis TaxID=6550 RepID=A0A8S3T6W9_MYTED|nr:unnamed protein product [Mytilus edulis]